MSEGRTVAFNLRSRAAMDCGLVQPSRPQTATFLLTVGVYALVFELLPWEVRQAREFMAGYYPIADVIASQYTVKSPANGCGPCSITCSLRTFPSESTVVTSERYPTSFTKVLL